MSSFGGSFQLLARRNTKKTDRKENAEKRLLEVLGQERMDNIRENWASIDTSYGGSEWLIGQGIRF